MKTNYIKSPLNYTGGKYKLLPQLIPLFPDEIMTFVDVFAGGCNVGVNVCAERVIFNDSDSMVIEMIEDMSKYTGELYDLKIKSMVEQYDLDRDNKESYIILRDLYNSDVKKRSEKLFLLVAHSFSNQIRFNKRGEFNLPFGKRTYNDKMSSNLVMFIDSIRPNTIFQSKDFREVLSDSYYKDPFYYCDPPYLITTATYNENGGWTEDDDKDLLSSLDILNEKGVKFGLSNVFYHKGKSNDLLIEWAKKYNIHYLNKDYKNCNYQSKNTDKKTVEVYVCNYQ